MLYVTNITRLEFWSQGKITIIKCLYFGILKDALYFDYYYYYFNLAGIFFNLAEETYSF